MNGRIRLLPVLIFVAALTLTLKLGSIWQGLDTLGPGTASAAAEDKAPAEKPAKNAGDAKAETGAKPPGDTKAAAKAKPTRPTPAPFDPTKATDAELEVLEKLAARRSSLDQRARDLDMRETLLRATETRIDGKIGELRNIKKTIEGLLKKHDAETEAKMKSLVKIYESMKPKDAARIFEKLDIGVLLDVVERMREARTAPILAKMSAAKAKTVTTALAARRALPKVGKNASKSTGK